MITGVVLARNEQENIVPCLESLRPHVAEIILIDMESGDRTVELARPYVSRTLRHPLVPNFDPARNLAITEAQHEWLWFLDADERIQPTTGRLVNQLVRERGHEIVAITIPFKSYFCGQWMQHCGWWPGYTMPRVLKRGHFRFAPRLHGGVEFHGPELRLPANPELAIEHFSYRSLEHYVEKFNRYTSTEAANLAAQHAGPDWEQGMRALMRDLWLYYERNEGHKDGYLGWILSWLAGQYRWFSLAKLADLTPLHEVALQAAVPENLDRVLAVMRHELGQLRATSGTRPWGLVLRSPLFDPSGYAEDARMLLKAAAEGSRAVTAVELPWSDVKCNFPSADAALFRALLRAAPANPSVSITNCIPTLCQPDSEAAFNVLRTLFETDRVPEHWLPQLEQFDQVWVWARHNAVAFRRGGVAPERIRILPGFVDTGLFCPDGPRIELPQPLRDRFVFLSVFDWQLRKGWDVLLRAYCEEFSATDPTGLLLKFTRLHGFTDEQVRRQIDTVLSALGLSLVSRPDIVLWDATLDQSEMAALYRAVDAFVLASRGEGWGRPYMEAMATGLPTIGTRGSGNEDFMDETNSFLVDTTPSRVPDDAAREIPVYEGHFWHEPRRDSLRRAMRTVHSIPAQSVAVGQKACRDMRELFSLAAGTRVLETMIQEIERERSPSPPAAVSTGQVVVELEGEFFAGHSFSNINEQLALNWVADGQVAVSLKRVFHNPTQDGRALHGSRLRPYFARPLDGPADVVIRHAFPPNWEPPVHGRWVHIQPWEYGALPRDWIEPLRDLVDEIWAPSHYVQDVYIRSGIPADKIVVIPWGIDPEVYRPDVPPLHLPTKASFKFLYVGGSVHRKGIDVLLQAYVEEFAGDRNVCLVIKDLGTSTFYRHGNYRQQILSLLADPGAPPMVYIDREMTDGQRASLYAACDCLVAPYRGEGFGLPVLEAMACGVPPLVPRGGATDDFVSDAEGFFVPATLVECDHDWRLCGPATELCIAVADLRRALRQTYEDRYATQARGRAATEKVRSTYTWKSSAQRMVERMRALAAWGPAACRQSTPPVHSPGFPLDLTVCLATRNNERTLADCLARVRPFVREIVVADEQSTDRTVPLAREYGARVYSVPPSDSQSNVRNVALRRATSEWILSLRADDLVDDHALEQIAALLAETTPDILGYSLRCPAVPGILAEADVRVFRNHNQIVYEGRALERVVKSIRRLGGQLVGTDIAIRPAGSNGHADVLQRLHQDFLHDPAGSENFWRLGLAHVRAGNYFHAECYLSEFLRRVDEKHADYVEAAKLLIGCYQAIDDPIRAQDWRSKLDKLAETRP